MTGSSQVNWAAQTARSTLGQSLHQLVGLELDGSRSVATVSIQTQKQLARQASHPTLASRLTSLDSAPTSTRRKDLFRFHVLLQFHRVSQMSNGWMTVRWARGQSGGYHTGVQKTMFLLGQWITAPPTAGRRSAIYRVVFSEMGWVSSRAHK